MAVYKFKGREGEYNRKYQQMWRAKNPDKARGISYRSYLKYKDERILQGQRNRRKAKAEVLTHYGNGKLACVLCGEDRLPCLSIDHLDGGGVKHRLAIGRQSGWNFYCWLRKNNYPVGYQTLCMNCQFVKRKGNKEEN